MAVTFKQYLKQVYDASPNKKRYYGSFAAYYDHCSNHGFGKWLEANRGEKLTLNQTVSVAKTFLTIGKRTTGDIPAVLAGLMRQYDIEIPVIEGILTKQYWDARFQSIAIKA